jgi:hypothetical protein
MFAPKTHVVFIPSSGPERKALVLSKVKDVSAYQIRTTDGRRLTVPASQLRPSNDKTR